MDNIWMVAIVAIAVLGGTLQKIAKLHYKSREASDFKKNEEESERIISMEKELTSLKKRVANLESILIDLDRRS